MSTARVDADQVAAHVSAAAGNEIAATDIRRFLYTYAGRPGDPQPPQPAERRERSGFASTEALLWWDEDQLPEWVAWYRLTRHRAGNPGGRGQPRWSDVTPAKQAVIGQLIAAAGPGGRVTPRDAATAAGLGERTAAGLLEAAGVPLSREDDMLREVLAMIAAETSGNRATIARVRERLGISWAWARELMLAAGRGQVDDEAALAQVREMIAARGPQVTATSVATTVGISFARAKELLTRAAGPKPGPDLTALAADDQGRVSSGQVVKAYGVSPSWASQSVKRERLREAGRGAHNELLLYLDEVRALLG